MDTPSGVLLKTASKGSVANVYLADWNTVDVPLQPLRDRGWHDAADEILRTLTAMTPKRLTPKNPNIPTVDAVAHWADLRVLLQRIAALYRP